MSKINREWKNYKEDAKVNIRLGRDSNRKWHLEVESKTSGLRIVDVTFDSDREVLDFFSNASGNATGFISISPKILRKHESKAIQVKVKKGELGCRSTTFQDIFRRAEKENPGWKADFEESQNSHRVTYSNGDSITYKVILRRYV